MFSKKMLLLLRLFVGMLLVAVLLSNRSDYIELKVMNHGKIVFAKLVDEGGVIRTRGGGRYCKFDYHGIIFGYKVDYTFDGNINDTIAFYHSERYPDVFVMGNVKKSHYYSEFSAGLIVVVFLFYSLYYIDKKR